MTQKHENQKGPSEPSPSEVMRLQFGKDNAFQVELQRRVDESFRSPTSGVGTHRHLGLFPAEPTRDLASRRVELL